MIRRMLLACACAALLGGCAAKLVPDDYTGPTAMVRDSSVNPAGSGQAGTGHSQYFVLAAVDRTPVQNSFSQTFAGAEGYTNFRAHERKVPVRPMEVTLRAIAYFPEGFKRQGGASGMDAVTTAEIQRTVSFEPVVGETYIVRGAADDRSASAWIETAGGRRVTETAATIWPKGPGTATQ